MDKSVVKPIIRAYKFKLDPTKAQESALARHAGAARFAYNFHLARKIEAHRAYNDAVALRTYTEFGHLSPVEALVAARKATQASKEHRVPTYMDSAPVFRAEVSWYNEHTTHAWMSGMRAADAAWSNWLASLSGKRKGPKMGYPRFKRKGASGSFSLYHSRTQPTLRPEGYRRWNLPKKLGGPVRLSGDCRALARKIKDKRADVSSVTISSNGLGWWLSVLVEEVVDIAVRREPKSVRGQVGVDLGISQLAALSTGEFVANPKNLAKASKRMKKAQRALSRKGWRRASDEALVHNVQNRLPRKPTTNRVKAVKRLSKIHAEVARGRATATHALTKRLATEFSLVAIEDLNVKGMLGTPSPKPVEDGTFLPNGKRSKAGLNRSLSDANFSEVRRQLTYKAEWYRSSIFVVDRFAPTSKICSECGWKNDNLTLKDRKFECSECGMVEDRDTNAAKNILQLALNN